MMEDIMGVGMRAGNEEVADLNFNSGWSAQAETSPEFHAI